MKRAVKVRIVIHSVVLVVFLIVGAYCLTPAGRHLANSVPFVTFLSNFAITYGAASSLEAVHAGRKADPDDPV